MPATVVYFTSYEQFKILLGYQHAGPTSQNWYKPVLAGSGARGEYMSAQVSDDTCVIVG